MSAAEYEFTPAEAPPRTQVRGLGKVAINPEMADFESPEQDIDPAIEDDEIPEILGQTSRSFSMDPVKDYLKEIGKIPLLKGAAEEADLSKRIEAGLFARFKLGTTKEDLDPAMTAELLQLAEGGDAAKKHMIEANLRLVVNIAARFKTRSQRTFLELIQDGNLGLIHAVEMFDYQKGYKFSTYATWWIRQSILRAIADTDLPIRLPVHQVEALNRILSTRHNLYSTLGRKPTTAEIASELGPTKKELLDHPKRTHYTSAIIEEYLGHSRELLSLDAGMGENKDDAFGDIIEDGDAIQPDSMLLERDKLATLDLALAELDDRQETVLRLRYGLAEQGEPKTLDAISKIIGLTRERIRQIEKEALAQLRKSYDLNGVRP